MARTLPMRDGAARAGDSLDEGFSAFLDILRAAARAIGPNPSVETMRRAAHAARLPLNEGGPVMHEVRDATVGKKGDAIRVRLYHPIATRPLPVLVYFHGGGWTILGIETHDRLVREYADASGWAVASLDYPLAPETTFPQTLDACAAAVQALAEDATPLGFLPDHMVLGGDSAGANLAAATAIAFRDGGGPTIKGLLLNYGVFDNRLDGPSVQEFGAEPFQLTREKMAGFWRNYCPNEALRAHPLASPLSANLCGLPPVHLAVAEQDILRDENLAFAAKLEAAGVAVAVERLWGAPHGFLEAVAIAPASRRAVERAGKWLRALEQQELS